MPHHVTLHHQRQSRVIISSTWACIFSQSSEPVIGLMGNPLREFALSRNTIRAGPFISFIALPCLWVHYWSVAVFHFEILWKPPHHGLYNAIWCGKPRNFRSFLDTTGASIQDLHVTCNTHVIGNLLTTMLPKWEGYTCSGRREDRSDEDTSKPLPLIYFSVQLWSRSR